jgi:hypothetical protein
MDTIHAGHTATVCQSVIAGSGDHAINAPGEAGIPTAAKKKSAPQHLTQFRVLHSGNAGTIHDHAMPVCISIVFGLL